MQINNHPSENASPSEKASRFIDALKCLNAKERNFLMRYALCSTLAPRLSKDFERDLVDRLGEIGIEGLDGAQAVYFGMDYHFEWIHAALLLVNEPDLEVRRKGGKDARIEDVDLLVVLRRLDGHVVLVLIEAKGVTSFSKTQFNSKLERLGALRRAIGNQGEWITPVMLLMSPTVSQPLPSTLEKFAEGLSATGIDFWPIQNRPDLLWMDLKGFFADIGNEDQALRIGTCDMNGDRAENLAERDAKPYTHWRVESRFSAKKRP